MKKTIIVSAITTILVNCILQILGWWIWPIIIICIWIYSGKFCFWVEEKFNFGTLTEKEKNEAKYWGPIAWIGFIYCYWEELNKKFIPKFRNPFFWPEKSE